MTFTLRRQYMSGPAALGVDSHMRALGGRSSAHHYILWLYEFVNAPFANWSRPLTKE